MKHFVYLTTNLKNGKRYIGKHSGEIEDDYLGSGLLIRDAIKKYGRNNFTREILCFCKNSDEAYVKEKEYIAKYNAVQNSSFYNIDDGGKGFSCGVNNPNVKDKKYGVRNPFYGKHHTEEAKEKNRLAHLGENSVWYGKHHTEETKQKISKANSGKNHYNYGGHLSNEHKDKLSASTGYHIKMFNDKKEFIQEFTSIRRTLKYLGLCPTGEKALKKAINEQKLYHGYFFEYS